MKSSYTYLVVVCGILLCGMVGVTQYWKINDYFDETKIMPLEPEFITYALGENLWTNKHTFDIKFNIQLNNVTTEFFAHKYILAANSPYFQNIFNNNTIDELTYYDINKDEFNSLMEILYFNNFNSNLKLEHLPNIVTYLNTFMIFNKYANHIDITFANMFTNSSDVYDCNSIRLVSSVYDISTQYNLNTLKTNILNYIYLHSKSQNLFSKEHVSTYPNMFYDYITHLNCVNRYTFN